MPLFVVGKVREALNAGRKAVNGSTVLLLGVTYKKDCADLRETPATSVARQLWRAGARVTYCDPYVPEWFVDGHRVEAGGRVADAAAAADLVILLQAPSAYDPAEIGRQARLLLDTRGVTAAGERL